MKKFLALILAVAMVASIAMLAGCSSANNEEVTADESVSEAQVLTMATNASFPPYEYKEDGETVIGIDAEIAEKIAEKLGMQLQIVDIEFGAIIAGVQSGKYDMGMAGMTVTEERQQSVNFSTTYATGVQVIIVPEGSEITSFDDIADGAYKVGVQLSTTGDIYATDDLDGTDSEIVEYETGNDAVAALVSGKVDAVIIDNEPAKAYVAANEGLTILDTDYVTEDYAICVAKENEELLGNINTALEELIADGTVKSIIDKYISAE